MPHRSERDQSRRQSDSHEERDSRNFSYARGQGKSPETAFLRVFATGVRACGSRSPDSHSQPRRERATLQRLSSYYVHLRDWTASPAGPREPRRRKGFPAALPPTLPPSTGDLFGGPRTEPNVSTGASR